MKRHKSLIPLSQDHHNGLMLAQLIKKNAPEYKGLPTTTSDKIEYVINQWESELKTHFQNEEKILFPFLMGNDKDLDLLITNLKGEHLEIERQISELINAINPQIALDELGRILEKHIRKEERQLFERAQYIFGDDLDKLLGKISSSKTSCKI